jgi:hypothetical protein
LSVASQVSLQQPRDYVKKIVLAIVLLAACRGSAPVTSASAPAEPGAASPMQAVEGFLKGVKDQDLQAIGNVWGDKRGPARSYLDRDEYETRLVLMQCLLSHDQSRVSAAPVQKADTAVVAVELRKGGRPMETSFKMLRGPASRWYVNMVEPLRSDFCRR